MAKEHEEIQEVPNAEELRAAAIKDFPALVSIFKRAKIIDDRAITLCHAVACSTQSYFDDDVWGKCFFCKVAVCHRPYVPAGDVPPKVCLSCLLKEENQKKLEEIHNEC